jgi:gliding motility-associated-like protein
VSSNDGIVINNLCGLIVIYFVYCKKVNLPIRKYIPALLSLCCSLFLFHNGLFAQMEFVQNKGQWDKRAHFKGDQGNGAFFIESKGFTVLLHHPDDLEAINEIGHPKHDHDSSHSSAKAAKPIDPKAPFVLRSHVYKVKFLGAGDNVKPVPEKMSSSYNNYFIGSDPSKWASDCKIYQTVTYKNMYKDIDVRYYSDAGGKLKYDFIVQPTGNENNIVMEYEGVDKLMIRNQELIINTSVGEIRELYPYTYEIVGNERRELECSYVLINNTVRFSVKNRTRNSTLVIDPTLVFSSLTRSSQDNWGYTATYGPDGSFFAGGTALGLTGVFPVSPGAFQQTFGGGVDEDNTGYIYDIAIMKLSANGSQRLYATYLGGSSNEQPHSMVCDRQGNLIIAGRTSSPNYPVTRPVIGTARGYDIIVTKFNTTGTALLGSIKMGGTGDDGVNIRAKYSLPDGLDVTRRNYGDDARSEVILDASGTSIFLASCTKSTDFPVAGSTIQNTYGGGRQDGVIIKFNAALTNVLFSSFFGGSGDDACFVLAQNPTTGSLYVAGGSNSNNLPGDRSGTIFSNYQGGDVDGFVTHVRSDGSGIIKTTYAGTSGADQVYGIQFDRAGFPYIMGTATGNWPILNAAYNRPGSRQFIAKLTPDLSSFIYSTTYGTVSATPNISPVAFLVDRCENVYISGWGGRPNTRRQFPSAGTLGMDTTINFSGHQGDGNDFYFMVMKKDAASLLMGAFFGQLNGDFDDHVDGGTSRFDANGIIYQAMCANCGGGVRFPVTAGVWGPVNGTAGANGCNQAAVKIEMDFTGVGAGAVASINGVRYDTVGCVPLRVQFTDSLRKGKRYIWDFGDGSPRVTIVGSSADTSHVFTSIGRFRVMLIAIDSATCNIADTAYVTIRVGDNAAVPNFTAAKLPPCESLTYAFTNTSTTGSGGFGPRSFVWNYGDGSAPDTTGFNPRQHVYAAPGTYRVSLTIIDTNFCNTPDSFVRTIRINALVKADFRTPARGCVPYRAVFTNTSLAGTDFIWDFGDGIGTSTDPDPVYVYNNIGTYTVQLIAIDTSTCNRVDTFRFTIQVFPIPTPGFTWAPDPPEQNRPTRFTNTSIGAIRYRWDFGDGESSTERDPIHQFNATGAFNVCLFATNEAGCTDSVCSPVNAIVLPLLDVPNAFTPGRFGQNSIIRVAGFGIGRMDWRIYNRWGQVVFRTNDRRAGWDGTFNGALQPMDVYNYTLDVEFTDGKKLRKTGDITLLR